MINHPSILDGIPPVGYWVYVLLAVSVIFEGPIATLLASMAASAGYLNPAGVFVFAALGNTAGDYFWYLVGRAGNLQVMGRFLRWFGVRSEQLEKLEEEINGKASRMLFVAKFTLGFMVPTLIATGLARVPWRRWSGALFLAECLWTGGLVTAGYFLGAYILTLESGLRYFALGATIVSVLFMIWYFGRLYKRRMTGPS